MIEGAENRRNQNAIPNPPIATAPQQFKIQPFWKNAPELWFSHVENQFRTANVISEDEKYNSVVGVLDETTALQVGDIIRNPPLVDKYDAIKSALINRFCQTEAQKVQQLLTGLTLGDKKPSQLLRELNAMAQGRIDADLIKSIWIQRLPQHIRGIILTAGGNLEHLGQLADQILEAAPPATTAAVTQPDIGQVINALAALTQQVADLREHVFNQQRSRSRSRNQSQPSYNRNRSSSAPRPTQTNATFCWYHNTFGTKATKCRQPCTFYSNQQTPGN